VKGSGGTRVGWWRAAASILSAGACVKLSQAARRERVGRRARVDKVWIT
jgi:hypothetical protein